MVISSTAATNSLAIAQSSSKNIASSTTANIAASRSVAAQSVTSVTLGQTASANAQLYAADGSPPAVPPPLQVWEQTSSDSITVLMASNYAQPLSSLGFGDLGAALLNRFQGGTADTDNFSQSITQFPAGTQLNSVLKTTMQNDLHTMADNQIGLKIQTVSGAQVQLSLSSQANGLAVQVQVTGGRLTDADRDALAKLGDAFQSAINGLAENPPKLDLAGLTKFDTNVLSSIDLHTSIKVNSSESQTLDFHADSKQRTVSSSGPIGDIKLSVDLTNTAIIGNAKQQAKAVDSYLKQFDAAQRRGHGDTTLMDMFKGAFTGLNSNYPTTATQDRMQASKPQTISLNQLDHNVLTGLGDFSASVTQNSVSSNPMLPGESDTFSYQLSQASSVTGRSQLSRSISQKQQSNLSASYHESLVAGLPLELSTDKKSQNYLYHQINDDASSVATISYDKGALTKASLVQTANQSERVQKYMVGKLVDDQTYASHGTRTEDFLTHFKSLMHDDDLETALNSDQGQQALSAINDLAVLQSDPGQLENSLEGSKLRALLVAPQS